MSDFLKKFLTGRAVGGTESFVHVGAFGKHPGWDDHIEDIGLESDSLVQAKRLMYVQGIGGQIDTGAWEQLPPPERLEEFNHVWLWARGKEVIVGRMWSSVDGKGRTRYPMVLAVHVSGVSLDRVLAEVLPKLQEVEKLCKETSSARGVQEILLMARTELRSSLLTAGTASTDAMSADARQAFVDHKGWGTDGAGLSRVIYDFKSKFATFARDKFSTVADANLRAQQARVPSLGMNPQQSLVAWEAVMRAVLGAGAPVLFFVPEQGSWVDVTVGEPGTAEFFCLRATPQHNPLSSDIPYKLDERFLTEAGEWKSAFARNVAPPAPAKVESPKVVKPLSTDGSEPKASGKMTKVVVVVVVILLGLLLAIAFVMANKSGDVVEPQAPVKRDGVAPVKESSGVPAAAENSAAVPTTAAFGALELAANSEDVTFEVKIAAGAGRAGTNCVVRAGVHQFPVGSAQVVARLSDAGGEWPTQTNQISITAQKTGRWEVAFKPGGLLVAGVIPPTAQISIKLGGKLIAPPATGSLMSDSLRPGRYEIVASLESYDSWQTNITVKSGETVRLPVVELFEARGKILWSVNLAGAGVELRDGAGKGLKKLPGTSGVESLDPGQYEVAASYEGLEPVKSAMLSVAKRGTNVADLKLDYFVGAFVSEPPGASVTAGARKLGVTPVKQTVLRERSVQFELAGFYTANVTVKAGVGETNTVRVTLSKIPPWPVRYTNPVGMEFVWVEGMPGKADGGVWVGKYEVTEDEWAKVMGAGGKAGSKLPMVKISGTQAQEFIAKLSALDAKRNYQLPDRAQWDFLAKISRESPATSVERAVLNPDGGTRQQPEPVGAAYATNRFGISDVFGNVSEMLAEGKSVAGQSFLDFVVAPPEESVIELRRVEVESGVPNVGLRMVIDSGMQSGAPR